MPFLLGELLADAVAGVAHGGGAAAGQGDEFFAEGEEVVALHVCPINTGKSV
jgi:hypothetical protein